MKTLTVQEASEHLGEWLRRAVTGEQIAIHEGDCTVLLQPVPGSKEISDGKEISAREALSRLQSRSQLTAARAAEYLRELRAERLAARERQGG